MTLFPSKSRPQPPMYFCARFSLRRAICENVSRAERGVTAAILTLGVCYAHRKDMLSEAAHDIAPPLRRKLQFHFFVCELTIIGLALYWIRVGGDYEEVSWVVPAHLVLLFWLALISIASWRWNRRFAIISAATFLGLILLHLRTSGSVLAVTFPSPTAMLNPVLELTGSVRHDDYRF